MFNSTKNIKSSLSVYKKLLKTASSYRLLFIVGLCGTILASGADAGLTWLIKPLIDKGIVAREKNFVTWIPLILVLGFIIRGGCLFISNYFISRVGRSVVMDFRKKIFNKFLRLPVSFYDKESSGKLLSLIVYNADQLASASTDAVLIILQEGLQLIGYIVVMFLINWQLSLICLVTFPTLSYVIRFTTKRLRTLSGKVQQTIGDVTHIAEEGIQGVRVIRTFGGEEYERKKFDQAAHFNRHCEMKVVVTNSIGTSIVQIIAALPLAIILYVATMPSLHVSVGDFGAILGAMIRILTPMRRLTKVNTDIQKGVAAANSIFSILEEEEEKDFGKKTIKRAKGLIEYNRVNFCYQNGNRNALRDISFTLKPGKTLALVGRSGSGKSTLVSLLPRFYEPNSGSISIDKNDISSLQLKNLREQFAFVSQNVVLFNDTIGNNIAYGKFSKAEEKEIMQAVKAAHLEDVIAQLPCGLNTKLGEGGIQLSGGQKQRIAIARAILKNAPILILDEATSSLDSETEHHIQSALDNLMFKRTTLVIAHRLSTIERADNILVMDQGQIIETGTHQDLLAAKGQYAKFYKMQFKKNKV